MANYSEFLKPTQYCTPYIPEITRCGRGMPIRVNGASEKMNSDSPTALLAIAFSRDESARGGDANSIQADTLRMHALLMPIFPFVRWTHTTSQYI